MAVDPAQYWRDFEAATGEKVEARAMGQWFRDGPTDEGTYGLLILGDRTFRYRYEPSGDWFSQFVTARFASSRAAQPVEIAVPRDRLISLERPRRRFLGFLRAAPYSRFTLSWKGTEDAVTTGLFSVDDAGGFLAALARAVDAEGKRGGEVEG